MAALSADRNTPRASGDVKSMLLASAAKVFAGAIAMRNATGYAVKGQTALNLRGAGVFIEQVDNTTGNDGDLSAKVREGTFRFANSAAGDAITIADVGKYCYAVDDQTVAKTNGGNTRSIAGRIVDVDALGVWVDFDEDDLADYLAFRRFLVPVRVTTLVGAGVYRAISPFAGRVVNIYSVIEGALTTGDATLTGKIDGAAITDGEITITQAGSAAGDKDSAAPSAANVVAAGGELSVTVGGTNATASAANVVFEIERD